MAVITFQAKDKEGKELTLVNVAVTNEMRAASNKLYNKVLMDGLASDMKLRVELEKILDDRHISDTSYEEKVEATWDRIKKLEKQLKSAVNGEGRKMTKVEGRQTAIAIKRLRLELQLMNRTRAEFLNQSVENMADNERIQYFIYATTRTESGEAYWKSFEDFKNDGDNPVSGAAATAFIDNMKKSAGLDEAKLPENLWLKRFGYLDSKLRLTNGKGQLVDFDDRLINEDGRWVNEQGQFVNKDYEVVDSDGQLILDDGWQDVE